MGNLSTQFVIITSINEPTKAVIEFSSNNNFQVVVVGDKKSPKDWKLTDVKFLSVEDQSTFDFELASVLPFNHYCRKMLGYLYAIANGANTIIDTDDDNIPFDTYSFPNNHETFDVLDGNLGFVNIYSLFTDKKIWPRGLPLKLINEKRDLTSVLSKQKIRVGIWQGLADEDPDVDAIYRLVSDEPCYFNDRSPVVLKQNTVCPFNSQNTLVIKELFPLLYLPTQVTFRFTDILRGLVAQPIMWSENYHLGFSKATVIQKRNPHDYMKDFISEIPMYVHTEKVVETVQSVIQSGMSISDKLFVSYEKLVQEEIVPKEELPILSSWLSDLDKIIK